MEDVSFVVEDTSFLTCAEAAEVLSCLRDLVLEELKDNSAGLCFFTFACTDLDVHEYLRILYVKIGQYRETACRHFSSFIDKWGTTLLLVVKAAREQIFGHLPLIISNLRL